MAKYTCLKVYARASHAGRTEEQFQIAVLECKSRSLQERLDVTLLEISSCHFFTDNTRHYSSGKMYCATAESSWSDVTSRQSFLFVSNFRILQYCKCTQST
uniref:AlNc14C83G5357 protein n=1 Tax=Albugo laibachii Nc14 TaxID=890382 RepID=F0WFH1_9STRA|nr:AlNc14C83G5357 [Albugo laibachii Nc14]|eukprot:CCA19953.1 AlNc14C83G5357 [Albugo laibachii Nc14]